MKILWITNTIFPDPSKKLGLPPPVFGGWMYGLAKLLANSQRIQLAVATTYSGSEELKFFEIDGINYYLLPIRNQNFYRNELEPHWVEIVKEWIPDIIHIHGTEYPHGLACMRAFPSKKYVISIQGLTSVYARYFYGGISRKSILKNITIRDILRRDTLFHGKKKFQKRGKLEKEYLNRTQHVIGRTAWDYTHVKSLNPSLNYHFCNESLRECFYHSLKWNLKNKKDYTIFLSQAAYPIKGLHQVLKAVALLKGDFPEVKIRVAGPNIIDNSGILQKLKLNGYGAYILSLIKKLGLFSHIEFVGFLNEEQIREEYKNAHIFVCPSSIENSPNSVGEAQLIGVPVVAAFVGGISDMVKHEESGLLYRFEETEMLAENIKKLFVDSELANFLSFNGIEVAKNRHNLSINLQKTIEIYNKVSGNTVGCTQ